MRSFQISIHLRPRILRCPSHTRLSIRCSIFYLKLGHHRPQWAHHRHQSQLFFPNPSMARISRHSNPVQLEYHYYLPARTLSPSPFPRLSTVPGQSFHSLFSRPPRNLSSLQSPQTNPGLRHRNLSRIAFIRRRVRSKNWRLTLPIFRVLAIHETYSLRRSTHPGLRTFIDDSLIYPSRYPHSQARLPFQQCWPCGHFCGRGLHRPS